MLEDYWVDPRPITFTEREREILEVLVVDGASNREIARKLYLSDKTVKFHLGNVMKKLGANNRTHVALIVCHQEKEAP